MERDGRLEVLSQTDSHQHAEGKWAQASARIYIEPQMDETFQSAYAEAIKTGIKREPLPLRWLRTLARQILWQVK